MTDRYAVIGRPVDHSLSPRIHAAFARQCGADLVYGLLESAAFETAAHAFFASGGKGLNVTVPFKEAACAWVDECDAPAAAAGAVNTIVKHTSGCTGHNTDGIGLVRDLEARAIAVARRRVLILGAGGAARGIVRPLLARHPDRLVIANRSPERVARLAEQVGEVTGVALHAVREPFDLVINATSAGLTGDAAPVAQVAVRGAICYDLAYGLQGDTPFCRWALRAGASAVTDGLGMLVEQAAAAFELWRGTRPDARAVLGELRG